MTLSSTPDVQRVDITAATFRDILYAITVGPKTAYWKRSASLMYARFAAFRHL